MRLFISINLPEALRQKIVEFVFPLRKECSSLKWVNQDSVHITLKFLGNIDCEDDINLIKSAIASIATNKKKFLIKLSGFGCFPSFNRPRIFWLGVTEGSDILSGLAQELEEKLSGKYKKEEREFIPHITLARIKNCNSVTAEKIYKFAEKFSGYTLGEFECNSISLMSSVLHPRGAIYKEVFVAEF